MTDGIFILSGSNMGDRKRQLSLAATKLEQRGIRILQRSSVCVSAAWGPVQQEEFLNQVLKVFTTIEPHELLQILLEVEKELGRERTEKWGPRAIDLDLLYYHQKIIRSERLTLPHPFIPERRFTLVPLVEIAPDFIHPVLKKDQRRLLEECPDKNEVKILEAD
jgi:2-amino-4-hydroxy-6-hydroxymethyldihydropteridine diphosphokinase